MENSGARNKKIKAEHDDINDPWCIKKKLCQSDISGGLSRLLLGSDCVESHILPFWNDDQIAKIKEGLPVTVLDCNTMTEHEMVFKKWNNGANVLMKNWVNDFVKRRELKLGDEIGLFWDNHCSIFKFAVLDQAAS
ncbi:hypothetical protein COLO4_10852 [Corchorus olitorius]|uniref:TF-B3 domain-containing protein n=1 Tax=Corchorus olitorius TaxID=93759 RepID=A0A1R3K6M0_9ROSI|nr:hypothetical protein COLO4_10852 [Corchorus olitorius]